jgi:hypothetical protein
MIYIPVEGCMREVIDTVKAGLLGEETVHTSLPAKLRKLA